MLRSGKGKRIYELHGEGKSIRAIARMLGVSRNTIRKYLNSPEVPKPAPRPKRASKLDPCKEYILHRVAEGIDNCALVLREIRVHGYTGGH